MFICAPALAQITPGARQISICNSDIAASDDVFAIFSNPAGPAQIPWRETGVFYSPAPFGIKELANGYITHNEYTAAGSFTAGIMTFGYNLYRETKILAGYSLQVARGVFFGSAVNYHMVTIKNYGNDGSLYLNAGALAYLNENISLGFSVINLNHSSWGKEDDQIPMVFHSGISFDYEDKFLIHLSAHKDVRYDFSVSGGVEYYIFNLLSIRSGAATEPLRYSLGTGIHISYFSFDYALSLHQDLGSTHQVSLIFSFESFGNRLSTIKNLIFKDED